MGSITTGRTLEGATQIEVDFEGRNWSQARETFKTRHKDTDQMRSFLQSQTTGMSVKETCLKLQSESDQKYHPGLGGILDKLDTLMKVGDLAIKSAPESVGLAWMGVRMCLHAVQGDFATFQLFSVACADIIGIMISCRVYGKMYGGKEGPEDFQELHSKVVDYIPNIYTDILDFSYAVRKYIDKHLVIRIGKNIFKDVKGDFQGMMDGIQAHETKMRDFAKIATDRLLVHYQKEGLKNQDLMQSDISFMKEALDANLRANEAFVRHIEALEEERKDMRKKSPYEKAKEEFEEWTTVLNPVEDQSDILTDNLENRREKGTCRWIFDLDIYEDWYNSPQSDILWVSGAAGYGKSILMSTLIESLRANDVASDNAFVQYFFCRTGDDTTQTTNRILQTIAYQLYATSEPLPSLLEVTNEVMKANLNKKGTEQPGSHKKTFHFETIYPQLFKAIGRSVFLVIDAIDECYDRQEKHLLKSLRHVIEAASTEGIRMKFVICSRPEADIADELRGVRSIKCEGHNEADIRKNVTAEMNRFPGWTQSEKSRACDEIVRKAGGQFRYVQIALNFLRKPLVRPYERALDKLPNGLTGSYVTSWRQTDPDYIELLQTALTWAFMAFSPVTVPEIMDAYSRTYSVDAGVNETQEDADSPVTDANGDLHDSQIRIAGGNFLEVSNSRFISLRHATVKDFFFNETASTSNNGSSANKSASSPDWILTDKEGSLIMSRIIVQNLASPAFQKKYFPQTSIQSQETDTLANQEALVDNEPDEPSHEEDEKSDASSQDTPTVSGPAVNGVNGAPAQNDSVVDETASKSEGDGGNIEAINDEKETGKIEDWYDDLSDNDEYVDGVEPDVDMPSKRLTSQNYRYETLYWHEHLKEAASLWAREEREQSPEWAEVWNHLTTFMCECPTAFRAWQHMRLFDIDSRLFTGRGDTWWTPLQVAVAFGLSSLAEKLIEHGQDVNERKTPTTEYGWRQSPLEIAAVNNDLEMIRLLLKNGADPNSVGNGAGAFGCAVSESPTSEVIKLFLDHGAKVSVVDGWSRNIMHYFARNANDADALRLLLDAGADINVADGKGETPLHHLVARNPVPIPLLKIFLETGAAVNIDDNESQRPLYEVARDGQLCAAEMLIEHGADVHDDDKIGATALHAAALSGKADVVKLLLSKGAVANQVDKKGRTPLYYACQGGSEEAAQVLLHELRDLPGDDINKPDRYGRTPLRKAAARGSLNIVKLLLEKIDAAAAINTVDSKLGQTCAHVAANNGQRDVLEVLIETGADLKVKDNEEQTPLQSCGKGWTKSNSQSHEKTVLLLIDHDRQMAAQTPELLFIAAMHGSSEVLDKLLDAGADHNAKDQHGWTPILLAQQYEQQEAIATLKRRDTSPRTKPTSWMNHGDFVTVSEDGLEMQAKVPVWDMISLFSDHPIPAGQSRFYFEVEVVSLRAVDPEDPPCCAVGLTTRPANHINVLPGHWNPGARSFAIHSDDGMAYSGGFRASYEIGPYGVGDVIGCAVDFVERIMFYTVNGRRHAIAFKDVWGRLYPAIGAGGQVVLKANFGANLSGNPWRWEGCDEWMRS